MSFKDKDGPKGLKKAFGAKGTDLKPEKFEKEKPGFTFKSWSTSVLTYVGLIEGGEEAKQMMKETIESKEPIEIQDEQKSMNEHIYGLLLLLTTGEANSIVQSHPDE
eukprot:3329737-Karenia_brevis.AAC.1